MTNDSLFSQPQPILLMTDAQLPCFFSLPKKEPKKATAKEHLTGVRSVPANGI